MPKHELSKNDYLEKIHSVVQQIMDSQKNKKKQKKTYPINIRYAPIFQRKLLLQSG